MDASTSPHAAIACTHTLAAEDRCRLPVAEVARSPAENTESIEMKPEPVLTTTEGAMSKVVTVGTEKTRESANTSGTVTGALPWPL